MGQQAKKKRNDVAQNQKGRVDQTPVAWRALKKLYPAKVKRRMTALEKAGGITLTDLLHVEVAEMLELDDMIRDPATPPRIMERLLYIKLQTRKHIRSILEATGDTGDADRLEVVVPEGLHLVQKVDEGDDLK